MRKELNNGVSKGSMNANPSGSYRRLASLLTVLAISAMFVLPTSMQIFSVTCAQESSDELNLWVASDPDAVKLYNGITGDYVEDFASSGDQTRPVDFTFGTDGDMFVSIIDQDSVKRFKKDNGDFIEDFVTSGSGGLDGPTCVRFYDNNLYVSSRWTNSIKRYDGQTGVFKGDFTIGGSLNQPTWMDWWMGDLYVSSFGSNGIKRYDGDSGDFIENFVYAGGGGLDGPQGIVFMADGYLYVVSSETSEVKRYDDDTGDFVENFVTAGSGGLDTPIDIQFADDYLYVTSFATDEVKRYDRDTGQFFDTVVSSGSGGLKEPQGIRLIIARDTNGNGNGIPNNWPVWEIAVISTVVFVLFLGIWIRRRLHTPIPPPEP